jgi:hypothetical protein
MVRKSFFSSTGERREGIRTYRVVIIVKRFNLRHVRFFFGGSLEVPHGTGVVAKLFSVGALGLALLPEEVEGKALHQVPLHLHVGGPLLWKVRRRRREKEGKGEGGEDRKGKEEGGERRGEGSEGRGRREEEGGGRREEGGGKRVEGGGWRVEGGGWRM